MMARFYLFIKNMSKVVNSQPTVGKMTRSLGNALVLSSRIQSYFDPIFCAAPPREKGRLIYATCIITTYCCVIPQRFVYIEEKSSKTIVVVRL